MALAHEAGVVWLCFRLGQEAMLTIPMPDHYLPLVYVIGARQSREAVTFPVEGLDGGSTSMLAVHVG